MTEKQEGTHQVFNQPAALENYNVYQSDAVLQYWVKHFGGDWGEQKLIDFGHTIGHELLTAGFTVNHHTPEFHSHDRFGHRVDVVNYHPAYHQLMAHAIKTGHCSLPWTRQQPGAHIVRAALAFMHTHADPGSGCPLTMTFAAVPAIANQPELAERWLPKILSCQYDGSNRPWFEKEGLTIGMAMTEKQGGSDVRANTTTASPVEISGPGQRYLLTGHKWFCSAPMSDAFLVLAQANNGLSCFLVPRWREDGSKNTIEIQRLKNKLGNRSNASAEIELRQAEGRLLGKEGRGVATIIQMVSLTRYDCMLGSSALMAQAVKEAIWHTGGREVFGKLLHQQPLMINVLADMALEAEAALAISLRVAKALESPDHPDEAALVRCGTAIGKYWIGKQAVQLTYEAMECVGGVGYVEENVLSRLYREAPVNAIWEGSGNIQCLDLLRIVEKSPHTLVAFCKELNLARGHNSRLDQSLDWLQTRLYTLSSDVFAARQLMETLAICWQASTLLTHGETWLADAFIASRLGENRYRQYGTLPEGIDAKAIVKRAMPAHHSI